MHPCSTIFDITTNNMSKPRANTSDHINSLEKTKTAIDTIKERLQPVIDKVNDDDFGVYSGQAHATVALSIGMLKYMAARLQGKDHGRKADDPLRSELNNMKRVLAEIKKKTAEKVKKSRVDSQTTTTTTEPAKTEPAPQETKPASSPSNTDSSSSTPDKQSAVGSDTNTNKKRKSSNFKERGRSKSPKSRKKS